MSAALLLDELRTLGVKVWPDAGALRFKAPAGAITPDLTARLKAFKPELLAILANDDSEPAQDLPLLAVLVEFDALIERLSDLRRYDDETRGLMRTIRSRMSPDSIRTELPIVRRRVNVARGE